MISVTLSFYFVEVDGNHHSKVAFEAHAVDLVAATAAAHGLAYTHARGMSISKGKPIGYCQAGNTDYHFVDGRVIL